MPKAKVLGVLLMLNCSGHIILRREPWLDYVDDSIKNCDRVHGRKRYVDTLESRVHVASRVVQRILILIVAVQIDSNELKPAGGEKS